MYYCIERIPRYLYQFRLYLYFITKYGKWGILTVNHYVTMGFWKGSPDFLNLRMVPRGPWAALPTSPLQWVVFLHPKGLRKMAPQLPSIWHPERRVQVYIFLDLHIRLAQVPFGAKKKKQPLYYPFALHHLEVHCLGGP